VKKTLLQIRLSGIPVEFHGGRPRARECRIRFRDPRGARAKRAGCVKLSAYEKKKMRGRLRKIWREAGGATNRARLRSPRGGRKASTGRARKILDWNIGRRKNNTGRRADVSVHQRCSNKENRAARDVRGPMSRKFEKRLTLAVSSPVRCLLVRTLPIKSGNSRVT